MSLRTGYKILEEIATGAMGTISKGIQRSLDRPVAIKQIHPHFSKEPEFVARFEREAKASGGLKHVNVLDIIDFGLDDDGRHYIVMEYIDGPNLQALLEGGEKLPLAVVLSVAVQLLDGLEHAHNHGVVHRDVKPANVMLTRAGIVKIADFGIAQASKLPSLTQAGERLGTPSYMSPEQAAGKPIDLRSDIFSVGVLLYQLVTNKLPFEGNTLAVLHKIIHEPPPPIETVDPSVPEPVVALIDKALEKDPTKRYFDAAEFSHEAENAAFALGLRLGSRVCKEYLDKRFGSAAEETKGGLGILTDRPSSGVKKPRPSLGLLPLQGCFGCHVNLLDLHEGLVDVHKRFDIKFSYLQDLKEPPQLDIGLVEGCVANAENEERLRAFRDKCGVLVALGTCACFGGVPGLRNLFPASSVIRRAYLESESTHDGGKVPDQTLVPRLSPHVRAVSDVVRVDGMIPGCPSPRRVLVSSISHLLEGTHPKVPTHNLCVECGRHRKEILTAQRKYVAADVKPLMELDQIDPDRCFLEQGVLCLGMVTREGCGARCLSDNIPCQGCMGPPPQIRETGAKWVDAIGPLLPGGTLRFKHDLVGSGYRYTLPVSMMPARVDSEES